MKILGRKVTIRRLHRANRNGFQLLGSGEICDLLMNNSLDVITMITSDGVIRYESPSIKAVLGYLPDKLVGRSMYDLVHPNDKQILLDAVTRSVKGNKPVHTEFRFRHKNGLWRYLESIIIKGVILCSRDISEQKTLQKRIDYHKNYDVLTGLPNRSHILKIVQEFLESDSWITEKRFALAVLGLDRFKLVNESLGHCAGDRVLKIVAERLSGCIRRGDRAARLGEDKFIILINSIQTEEDVRIVVNRVQNALTSPVVVMDQKIIISATMGITLSAVGYASSEIMLRDADIAMYRAKQNRRGSYEVFQAEMYQWAMRRFRMEQELVRALEQNEFVVYYLPTVSLNDGKIVGVEALVRWRHAERGLVMPDEFIPVAEESGLINAIGEMVLRTACKDLANWIQLGRSGLRLAVNFSVKQLHTQNVPALLKAVLTEYNIASEVFELEITESTIMNNDEQTTYLMDEIERLGISIAVDDFGIGYSSLSYLKRLPCHVIKIDRSFVKDIVDDEDATTIAKTIILMGHSLGLKVLAEGVETQEQLALLKEFGCDEIQGYLFSKPVPAGEISQILKEDKRLNFHLANNI